MSMFVDHLVFMVQDVGRNEAFYTPILGEPLRRAEDELEEADRKLTAAGIQHSTIQPCKQSGLPMIWFDDPDGMRVEFYLRRKDKQLV